MDLPGLPSMGIMGKLAASTELSREPPFAELAALPPSFVWPVLGAIVHVVVAPGTGVSS